MVRHHYFRCNGSTNYEARSMSYIICQLKLIKLFVHRRQFFRFLLTPRCFSLTAAIPGLDSPSLIPTLSTLPSLHWTMQCPGISYNAIIRL
jgi:hypothetical protein